MMANDTSEKVRDTNSPSGAKSSSGMGISLPKLVSSTGVLGDAILFGMFAALGIAYEIITHAFTQDTFFIIAGPILVLGLYLLTSISYRRFRLRFDQLGDNCYYLGFLFTLTALSIALYDFRSAEGGINAIIGNFGVALASTIAGIVLRVVLSQMREDPVEVEEQSRYELAEASARLKAELYASVEDMNSFRGLLQQSVAEAFDGVNERSREAIIEAAEDLSQAANKINLEIAERNENMRERFDLFNNLTQRTVSSLEALVGSLEGIRPPNDQIQQIFQTTNQSIENFGQKLENFHSKSEAQREGTQVALETAKTAIHEIAESLSELTGPDSSISSIAVVLSKLVQDLSQLSSDIVATKSELDAQVTNQSEKLNEMNAATSESIRLMKSHNTELLGALEQNKEMLAEVEKNLAGMARALVKAVG